MSKFFPGTHFWGGNCCGSNVYSLDCAGVNLRFDKPWDDGEEGRGVATIETSLGNIYAKYNLDNKYHRPGNVYAPFLAIDPLGPSPRINDYDKINIFVEGIEHYTCREIYEGNFPAQVGLAIAADNYEEYIKMQDRYLQQGYLAQAKAYEDYANLHKDEDKKVREKLTAEGILLYESPPFYNMTHFSRVKPSLTFFVYDKGLKQ